MSQKNDEESSLLSLKIDDIDKKYRSKLSEVESRIEELDRSLERADAFRPAQS
jgi:hypothetical protein